MHSSGQTSFESFINLWESYFFPLWFLFKLNCSSQDNLFHSKFVCVWEGMCRCVCVSANACMYKSVRVHVCRCVCMHTHVDKRTASRMPRDSSRSYLPCFSLLFSFVCLLVGTVSYWESLTHQRSDVISQKLSTHFTGQNLLLNPIKLG